MALPNWEKQFNTNNIKTGEEVATNQYIDGKQVYCTRLSLGGINNGETKSINFPIENKALVRMNGIALSSYNGRYVAIPCSEVSLDYNNVAVSVTNNKGFNLETFVYVDVYYVKQ